MEQGNNTTNDDYPRNYREFKIGTFKIFGGIQISLGVVCGIVSMAGIATDAIHNSDGCTYNHDYTNCNYYWYSDILLGFDITCFILSGWFLLTGSFPFCMNKDRQSSWRCLKITYMVLCIVGAAVVVPTMFIFAVDGSFVRSYYESDEVAIPALIALTSFAEAVISIVAASICCCCSSFNGSWSTTYVSAEASQSPGGDILVLPTTQIHGPYIQTVQQAQTQSVPFVQEGGAIMTQPMHLYHLPTQTIASTAQPPPSKS